jgi:hypothetical protein
MRLPPLKRNDLPPDEGSDPHAPVTKYDMKHGLLLSDIKSAAIALVAVVGGTWGVWKAVTHEAQAQVDAGVEQVKAQVTATQRELERFQHESDNRMGRVEKQGDRTEQKIDALLGAFRVPNPAPAPIKDGGR